MTQRDNEPPLYAGASGEPQFGSPEEALARRRADAEFRKPGIPGGRSRKMTFRRFSPDLAHMPAVPAVSTPRRAARKARREREQRLVWLILLVAAAMVLAFAVRYAPRPAQGVSLGAVGLPDIAGLRDAAGARWEAVRRDPAADEPAPLIVPADVTAPTAAAAADTVVVWPTPITASRAGKLETTEGARRLTDGGCCAGAWWSADGSAVRYLDRDDASPIAGIFEVPVWPPGMAARTAQADVVSGSAARFAVRRSAQAIVEDVASGEKWPVPSGTNPARVGPDGQWVVWWEGRSDREFHDIAAGVFAAPVGGGEPRELTRLWGASVVAFHPQGDRIIVTGRPRSDSPDFVLSAIDVDSQQQVELARGAWLSDAVVSPGGSWVAYMVSLDAAHPEANGIWIAPTSGGPATKLPFVGAYRWRDDTRLVFLPLDLEAPEPEVWEYDALSGDMAQLLAPAFEEVRVANNDWSISPDGWRMVFRSANDLNLYVVDLP